MVAKPAAPYRLPETPLPLGRLIEACFALWMSTWRSTFVYSLLYGLVGLLPSLATGALVARLLREGSGVLLRQSVPWMPPLGPSGDPDALLQAIVDWLCAPATWILFGLSLLGMLAALSLVIHRQATLGAGGTPSVRRELRHLPAGLAAWLIYGALVLAALAPLVLLSWLCFRWAVEVDLAGLTLLLVVFLAGGLLTSIPTAWISVAAGFAPVVVAAEGAGPGAAQWRSVRLVRGRWVHAAVAVTVPMLLYFGYASMVSSVTLGLTSSVAMSLRGWPALLDGAWLAWAHWLGLVPMAIGLPLATSGLVLTWNDLRLRAASH